jgi:hypothetical protein
MRELFILIAHLLVALAKLGPGAVLPRWGRITGGQTPAAHQEECAAACAESDLMGSVGAGSLCAFGTTQRPEQDGCDTEAFYPSALSPRSGEAQGDRRASS